MMKISEIDFTEREEVKLYVSLAKKILLEFAGLSEMYDEVSILTVYPQHYENGSVHEHVGLFLGFSEQDRIIPRGDEKSARAPVRSVSRGKKGCILIVVDTFKVLPKWKQELVVRHECCHLLHRPSYSPTLESLSKRYGQDWLANLVAYRREYQVHLCMMKRYLNDWLREPFGISKDIMSPQSFYKRERKMKGVRNAIFIGINNTVKMLSIIYLTEQLLTLPQLPNRLKKHFEQDLKRYKGYLGTWWRCLYKDFGNSYLLPPRVWLSYKHFEDEEIFFNQIYQLLAAIHI